jgi:hypothetical protein
MQVFDREPTDAQLAVLLDPAGRSQSVRVADMPATLVAQPRGIPMWFVILCALLPLGVCIAYVVHQVAQQAFVPVDLLGVLLGVPAVATFIGIVWWVNQKTIAMGDFFVLDRHSRTLTLPRQAVQVRDSQVRGFVEVHAWHTERDRHETDSYWLAELSVLVSTPDGMLARYPVLTCMRTGPVTRLGQALADFFGVERRLLRLDWRTRRRLRAQTTAGA